MITCFWCTLWGNVNATNAKDGLYTQKVRHGYSGDAERSTVPGTAFPPCDLSAQRSRMVPTPPPTLRPKVVASGQRWELESTCHEAATSPIRQFGPTSAARPGAQCRGRRNNLHAGRKQRSPCQGVQ